MTLHRGSHRLPTAVHRNKQQQPLNLLGNSWALADIRTDVLLRPEPAQQQLQARASSY